MDEQRKELFLDTCDTLLDEMFAESKVDKRAIKLMFRAVAFNAMKAENERVAAFFEGPCGDMQLADRNELRAVAAAIRDG